MYVYNPRQNKKRIREKERKKRRGKRGGRHNVTMRHQHQTSQGGSDL